MATILFIDDVPEIRQLYATVFSKRGHDVTAVGSALLAMKALESKEYDYVFVDVKIPNFDGFWFLKESHLIEKNPKTKVVVLSNSESPKDFEKAKALGVDKYLVKIDYSPYGLAQMIQNNEL
jgi:chemosensory pili system protein ChpA (sensor histidine kinase/response regulator)